MSERDRHRLRITFRVEQAAKYISHLDLLRAWERTLRRARLPLAYSQGFNPHPRITIAMPLPVGCTGEREIVDVLLEGTYPVQKALAVLSRALPPGISVTAAEQVPLREPALPSRISCAMYQIALAEVARKEVERRVADLMRQETFSVQFRNKTMDLRPLIGSLTLCPDKDLVTLETTLLRIPSGRIGRPDVLLEALGLSAHAQRIHRTRIVFEMPSTQKARL
jgi:radical SAM-linked protein